MPIANYKKTSFYHLTPQTSSYLGQFILPTVRAALDDEYYALEHRHQYRPDLLSYEKYGTTDYRWVFMIRNPDIIKDPIWDFVTGLQLYIPKKNNIG